MMPTPAPTPTPTKIDQISTAAGSGETAAISLANADAQRDAERRAERRQRRRLDEELVQDVAAARAERFPNADLARSLGDGDEHDVHDHDRADDEPDRRQRDAGDHEVALAACSRTRAPSPTSRARSCPAATGADDAARASPRAPPPSPRASRRRSAPGSIIASITPCGFTQRLSGDLLRRDEELVERHAEHAALLLGHADDGVGNALDAELRARSDSDSGRSGRRRPGR